jgi:hypothetical protein
MCRRGLEACQILVIWGGVKNGPRYTGRLPVGLYLLHVQTKTGRYHGRFAVGE